MECAQTSWLSDDRYWEEFAKKIELQRIPLSGSIDLTWRCNLQCCHCYLKAETGKESWPERELSTAEWLRVLDEIAAAGCLYLLITGGEPLLRPDFAAIYGHARRSGMLVTLFTNGTRLNEPTLALLQEMPPQAVEITLYGAEAALHDSITGVSGSFAASIRALEMLLAKGIKVNLKSILMTLNQHGFPAVEDLARSYGCSFRFDAAIFPGDGDQGLLQLRVPAEQAIEREFASGRTIQEWRDFLKRFQDVPFSGDLYQCGAAVCTFHVDPFGRLQPCLMVRQPAYDLRSGSFADGWRNAMPAIREKKLRPGHECAHCRQRLVCGYCPGFFRFENGAEEERSEYLCRLGKLRSARIEQYGIGG